MKKYKIILRVSKIINIVLLTTIIFAYIFFCNGFIEKAIINEELQEFKDRGILDTTVVINKQTVNMYKVIKKYEYEDTSRPIYDFDFATRRFYLGAKTDIILTSRNPMRYSQSALIKDMCGFFSNQFYCGHATFNTTDNGSQYVEAIGNGFVNGVIENENTWIDTEIKASDNTNRIIGLRIKDTTNEIRDNMVNDILEKVGCEYNYNFFIPHKNKYYCTDLITRTAYKYGIDMNYDNFIAIGNDLIISDETYYIFYIECIEKGIFNFYYLSEG